MRSSHRSTAAETSHATRSIHDDMLSQSSFLFIPRLPSLTWPASEVMSVGRWFGSPANVPVVMWKGRWWWQTTTYSLRPPHTLPPHPFTRNVPCAQRNSPIVVSHSLPPAMLLIKQHRVACCRGAVVTLLVPQKKKPKCRCCPWLWNHQCILSADASAAAALRVVGGSVCEVLALSERERPRQSDRIFKRAFNTSCFCLSLDIRWCF